MTVFNMILYQTRWSPREPPVCAPAASLLSPADALPVFADRIAARPALAVHVIRSVPPLPHLLPLSSLPSPSPVFVEPRYRHRPVAAAEEGSAKSVGAVSAVIGHCNADKRMVITL